MDRFYRKQFKTGKYHSFTIREEQSDLFIVCDRLLCDEARQACLKAREDIKKYINAHPEFAHSLEPVTVDPEAAPIIKRMAKASQLYGVGPMAAVAGAVARFVGEKLAPYCSYLLIENGGDIFVKAKKTITVSVYAGEDSPFNGKLRFSVDPQSKPLGICTSSGTVGHSLSFGNADAVVTVADEAEVADAAATAIANRVKSPANIQTALDAEKESGILKAVIIACDQSMGAWGNIQLV